MAAQRRLDLSTRVASALAAQPGISLEEALPQILMHSRLHVQEGGVQILTRSHRHSSHEGGGVEGDGLAAAAGGGVGDCNGAGTPGQRGLSYTLNDLQLEACFICGQLRTLLRQVGWCLCCALVTHEHSFLDALLKECTLSSLCVCITSFQTTSASTEALNHSLSHTAEALGKSRSAAAADRAREPGHA